MKKVVRFVIPSNEKEAHVSVRGQIVNTSYTKLVDTDQGNIELYIEDDDEMMVKQLVVRTFETGESVPSYATYLDTVNSYNRLPQHLYIVWSSDYEVDSKDTESQDERQEQQAA